MKKFFYEMTVQEALRRLDTDILHGLSDAEAEQRRREFGPNQLAGIKKKSPALLFLSQFKDPLVLLLILAALLSYYLKDVHAALTLIVIVTINGFIGFYQEYSAERILEELKKIIQAKATVLRQGKRREIEQWELVPGDIVYLEEGWAVPADLRLLQTHFLSTNDFILTGESLPQEKNAEVFFEHETTISNQDNLVFMGTTIAKGNGLAVVFGTGMNTAVGRIAKSSETIQRNPSTLQMEISHLAKILLQIAGWIAATLFVLNMIRTLQADATVTAALNLSILFAISIAAACVPQGLPSQITVALSLGVGRLARKNAVVKKLSAVETLGSTTVICTDKTGTLTKNEMTITLCYAYGREFAVQGSGYEPYGNIFEMGKKMTGDILEPVRNFFAHGFLASNGRALPPDAEHLNWYASGDPTEAAFTPLALKAGFDVRHLEESFPLLQELPFDSERKRMTIFRKTEGQVTGFMKGALSTVLPICSHILQASGIHPLSAAQKKQIEEMGDRYSAETLRVIALAFREFERDPGDALTAEAEQGFVFAGFVGMLDPPRDGVKEAIASCYKAKIRVMMLTGDNSITAKAIAEKIGMEGEVGEKLRAFSGDEIKGLNDFELRKILLARSVVFSRVSARDKLRIVSILKEMGEVVAVTGDGVNDTLCLKKADIGVAMGKAGSEVAKEASEIVLLDDDFSTLSLAIREGRTIFANLKKTVLGNIAANLGELTTVLIGFGLLPLGLPYPILAVQILAVGPSR